MTARWCKTSPADQTTMKEPRACLRRRRRREKKREGEERRRKRTHLTGSPKLEQFRSGTADRSVKRIKNENFPKTIPQIHRPTNQPTFFCCYWFFFKHQRLKTQGRFQQIIILWTIALVDSTGTPSAPSAQEFTHGRRTDCVVFGILFT